MVKFVLASVLLLCAEVQSLFGSTSWLSRKLVKDEGAEVKALTNATVGHN